MDFNNVNSSLMKLAELLKMSTQKPSHGYTISEAGPEIVTAPGVYFPSEKGEVIPLQSRAEGGSVSPTSPSSDTEKEKLSILRDIISVIKPRQGTESRQFGGPVSPDSEPSLMDQIEKTKYDIFKSAMSVLKPQPQKSYNERTSGYGSPSGKSQFSNSPSLPTTPSLPSLPGLPKPITPSSYGIMPESTKPSEGEALWQKKRAEQGWENPAEDLWTHKRREAGVLDLTSRQYGGFVSPDLEELKKRKQWEIPGYPERRLEEAKNILGPSILGVQPGFQESYYEAHPEEKLMDEETYRMKPLTDAIMKSIEDEKTRQQGYGLGAGTPRKGVPSQIPELVEGLKGLTPTLLAGGRRGILPAGVTTPKQPTLSPVGQLMAERDVLAPDDQRRADYDAAIKKATEQPEKTLPSAGNAVDLAIKREFGTEFLQDPKKGRQADKWLNTPEGIKAVQQARDDLTPPAVTYLQTETGFTPATTRGPGVGTVGKSTGVLPPMSEDLKKDYTAMSQASDLTNQLKASWDNLGVNVGVSGRAYGVRLYGEAKAGLNANAKTYLDSRDAFLGNLSRSIAAERGVLTNQDIDRISKAIPKIGVNPLSTDNKEEAEKKWKMVTTIIQNAEKRLRERAEMRKGKLPEIGGNSVKTEDFRKKYNY